MTGLESIDEQLDQMTLNSESGLRFALGFFSVFDFVAAASGRLCPVPTRGGEASSRPPKTTSCDRHSTLAPR